MISGQPAASSIWDGEIPQPQGPDRPPGVEALGLDTVWLVSYDLYIVQRGLAHADGVTDAELKWRTNNSSMDLILDVLDALGVLDHDTKSPRRHAAAADPDNPFEHFQRDPEEQKWEAEQEVRYSTLPPEQDVAIPAVKFSSNDYWLVHAAEARTIARALRRVTPDIVQRVLEADEDEIEAINDPKIMDPPDMPTAVSNVTNRLESLAEFAERAGRYGGFRVG